MPSLTEALGVTFLEALAAGCVPIGTCTGGIPEIIHDNENGLLVPPDQPEKLAAAVLRVLRDPALAERLAKNGLESLQPFSIDAMMACTYQVYQTVLKPTQIKT
jgi:glycosyltransferase involved in cell wall biosynthesis